MTTTVARSPREYEEMADIDTAAGNAAWNAGDIKRAIRMWKLAALWAQAARRVEAR